MRRSSDERTTNRTQSRVKQLKIGVYSLLAMTRRDDLLNHFYHVIQKILQRKLNSDKMNEQMNEGLQGEGG